MRAMMALLAVGVGFAPAAEAADLTVLVAEKGSPAMAAAEQQADGKAVFAERKIHKAFDRAAEHLAGCGACTVTIKVAAGTYDGKGKTGQWMFPEVVAPEATLRILGGYDEGFKARAPFTQPSLLLAAEQRSAPVLTFEGKKHALKELYLSGFVFDVAPGNKYDARSNSLLRGSSCTFPILAFGYLTTERLVVADNVFMNAAQRGVEPLIRAASPKTEVIVRNNFIMNNTLAWIVKSASFKNIPGRYVIQGNSFIVNWPYNPDPSTAQPAALEIGNKYTAAQVVIEDNLFAHNVGGAIMPGYDDKAGPPITIKNNLFFGNGVLFGATDPSTGAVVGKFNRAATHSLYSAEDLEDDFSWSVSGNVSFDPKVPVALVEPGVVDSHAVHAKKTVLNDVRGLFGLNKDGGRVEIKNFAPRLGIDLGNLPFPAEPKAKAYGVKAERVEQF